MGLSRYQILLAVGMLVTGSINTLSKKAQNDCHVKGVAIPSGPNGTAEATAHEFDHPWFQTIIMFIGESLCLLGLLIARRQEREAFRGQLRETHFQNEPPEDVKLKQPRIFQAIIILPTLCDLLGTTLAGIGLIYVSASVWQMLRGSIIIFTGILSKIFLKRQLKWFHWSGMTVTIFGLVLVGMSTIFAEQGTSEVGQTVLGILLILGGQVMNAIQMIIEEVFLKKRAYPPLQVVGMEGIFGFFILGLIVLPVLYFIPDENAYTGRYEDSIDAMYQIGNSPRLLAFCLLYLLSISGYNYFGLSVTRSLTAVHRTLIDACRTIVVWIVGLVIYYGFDPSFGEPFDVTYGILKIDGFMFLLIGTALYNNLFDLSFLPCQCFHGEDRSSGSTRDERDASSNGVGSIQDAARPEGDDDERAPLIKSNQAPIL
ncbi:solute carrier family 35 member F6 [Strongylocentrotus purpuratus]|uniref:Solute carrier family 35 member F6 n=1 Tax=Strongylocentrotus purpuratus TaxID=7668 RepID=A0A7M7N9K0_STRPU|nr:solute carrier family 35 member F6 [Strongylocentrotus purpuratus]|eukprot:XP_001201440.2 PREDICTED: solute carrier family 35 member F6 [Strongylocentrotus purpuratus]